MIAYSAYQLRPKYSPCSKVPDHKPERFRTILEYFTWAADNGQPCPTNPEIGERCGYDNEGSITHLVKRLVTTGKITIHNVNGNVRTVTIVATGKTTEPTKRR